MYTYAHTQYLILSKVKWSIQHGVVKMSPFDTLKELTACMHSLVTGLLVQARLYFVHYRAIDWKYKIDSTPGG